MIKTEFQGLVKLYREFSRQKYNRYKHKFPKMKEDQIIAKVQREWDNLDELQKKEIQRLYEDKNYIDADEIGKGSSRKYRREKSEAGKKPKTPQKMKVVEVSGDPKVEESDLSSIKDKKGVDESESASDRAGGKNSASKLSLIKAETKNREYLSFYKYYHDKLAVEHPKWKSIQISTIIKLLWKKRTITKKNDSAFRKKKIKAGKGLQKAKKIKKATGYLTFKKRFISKNGPGTTAKEVKKTFKRLTFEQKYQLNKEAKIHNNEYFPVKAVAHVDTSAKIANLESSVDKPKLMSFLSNIMK